MKSSRSRGTQQQREQAAAPLFPRVHVSETKNGPKAPPRNKMALYEHLTIPSKQLTVPSNRYMQNLSPPIWTHQGYQPQQNEIPSSSTSSYNSWLKDSSHKRRKNEDGFAVPIYSQQLKSGGAKLKELADAKHDGDYDGDTNLFKNLQEAQNSNASNASIVDLADKLVPKHVLAALGEPNFWRIRKTIIRQQQMFANHVFELHRLIQVQHMLAESPVLVLEPESIVPRLVPQPQSTPKTSSKTLVSKPVKAKSTATRSSNQHPSSGTYGANQWSCQPYMFQAPPAPIPVYTTGSGPSYWPIFGSHFAPPFQFYYHQNQAQQWLGTSALNPWYASYSPQLQRSTSTNSVAVLPPNGCADVHLHQQQQQQQQQAGFAGSTSGLTTAGTSKEQQQPQQNPRTSLNNAVDNSRPRISAFSHVSPTEGTTNQRTRLAPRPVMATPESAAGILKSIQREKHSSNTV